MNRRILYIIIGAVVILALILGLWFWLFSGGGAKVSDNTGTLGTAGNQNTSSTGTSGSNANGEAPIGSTAGAGVSGQTTTGAGSSGGSTSYVDLGSANPSDATWLDGSSVGSTGSDGTLSLRGAGSLFNPTPINQVNNASVYGTSYIAGDTTASNGSSNNFAAGLAGVAGACLAQFVAGQVTGALGSFLGALSGQVNVNAPTVQGNQQSGDILTCVARALARIAIQKITTDTVNWINSGFNGQPAFVQDYSQFFSQVEDQAAGSVIQGSNLAFLCSPFQLQVRIAIAQSYASRNNAPSCTLSGIVGNIQQFANGDFSQGGWPGLISFTTTPTNNPYGAYMYGQVAVQSAVGKADVYNTEQLANGQGFLSITEKYNCQPASGLSGADNGGVQDCQTKITTPGQAIVGSFDANVQSTLNSLNLADSIDQILDALTNALITKIFNNGLSNLGNGQNGYGASLSTEDLQAEGEANDLLTSMQTSVQNAQEYGQVEQGSISDIQNAQSNLTTLENCWSAAASSTDQTQIESSAQAAADKITELEGQVGVYNNNITAANQAIADIQTIQTAVLSATTLAEVQTQEAAFAQLQASGELYDSAAVTSAQQDRTTLQAQMDSINTDTSTKLNQCYALGQ